MKQLNALAVFLALGLLSLGAAAITLEPLPGSSPQETCRFCLFPNPIGIIARDSSGAPMPNVAVTFSIPALDGVITLDFRSNVFKMMTGPDGVAAPRFLAVEKDKATITASAPDAAAVQFELRIKGKGPAEFQILSGNGQSAAAWTEFAQPWKVRAVGRNGHPVPFAAVMFATADSPDYPGGLFGPRSSVVVAADAQGIATSPHLTANGTQGSGVGSAVGYGMESPGVVFGFVVTGPPASRDLALVWQWIPNNDVGWEVMGYTVRVTELAGSPAANVPVVFATDPACGYFTGGLSTLTATTDAEGLATSPTFHGISATTACAVVAKSAGAPTGKYPRHLFWPEDVVMTATPPAIEIAPARSFQIVLTTMDSGLPVEARPVWVEIIRDGAATAQMGQTPFDPLNPGTYVYSFFGNPLAGTYTIRFHREPIVVDVTVVQRR